MTRIVLLELANRDAEELVRSITEYGHLYFTDLSLSADPISTPAG